MRLIIAPTLAAAILAIPAALAPARADIAISSNDGHTILQAGVQVAPKPVLPDTISVIDLAASPPRITAAIEAPGSVVGPPFAVWLAPDETWCIVTSATKADPASPSGISNDDRLTVIDLTTTPPSITQRLTAGAGATSLDVTADGTLALVANRAEGTVSLFTINHRQLTSAGKITPATAKSATSGLAITRDGKAGLVTRTTDNAVSVLHIEGASVTVDPTPISVGVHPYTLDINPSGSLAAVSNLGDASGGTVSLINLTVTPFRVIDSFAVPVGPEGLKFSADGKFLAIGSQIGSQKAPTDPAYTKEGILTLYAIPPLAELGTHHPSPIAHATIGGWSQGIAFSRDSGTILVQAMADQKLQLFHWDGAQLTEGAPLPTAGGPAAIRTPWR